MFSSPAGTKMFQFPAFASTSNMTWMTAKGCRVVPFGYLRVKGRLRLTGDFRSLPRPSSPPRAKASAMRPCMLLIPGQSPHHKKKAGEAHIPQLYHLSSDACTHIRYKRPRLCLFSLTVLKPVIYFIVSINCLRLKLNRCHNMS